MEPTKLVCAGCAKLDTNTPNDDGAWRQTEDAGSIRGKGELQPSLLLQVKSRQEVVSQSLSQTLTAGGGWLRGQVDHRLCR
jgi:hypothetical protein